MKEIVILFDECERLPSKLIKKNKASLEELQKVFDEISNYAIKIIGTEDFCVARMFNNDGKEISGKVVGTMTHTKL